MADKPLCSIDGCCKPSAKRGWCSAHYYRWRIHGDPLGGGTPQGEPLRWLQEKAARHKGSDCLIWPFGTNGAGYARVTLQGRAQYVHRLVCEAVRGPSPTPSHQAAHSCGKGHEGCVNPRHLEWKTRAENEADKLVHGTASRGERCGTSKLTEVEVREIRALEGKQSQQAVADRFGIAQSAVSNIQRRKKWAWLR